jgi:hypothetical protein
LGAFLEERRAQKEEGTCYLKRGRCIAWRKVLPWSWRHSHEERHIPSLRAHLEEERRKASRMAHYIHERSHGGGGVH